MIPGPTIRTIARRRRTLACGCGRTLSLVRQKRRVRTCVHCQIDAARKRRSVVHI